MQVIYDCIDKGQIGIFESPTGTGKSLSLICASLTWLRDFQKTKFHQEKPLNEDSDEPAWVLEYEREEHRRQVEEQASALESRLRAFRAQELRQKQRFENGEPPSKRLKRLQDDDKIDLRNDTEFELHDYSSDDGKANNNPTNGPRDPVAGLSSSNIDLMQKLGLIPQQASDECDQPIDEVKIFFASRTHSQLAQFVKEVQRVHLPNPLAVGSLGDSTRGQSEGVIPIKHLPLGSRQHLCINPKVSKLNNASAISERCLDLQKPGTAAEHKCPFLPNYENETLVHQFRDHTLASVKDIEDTIPLGRGLGICPYYASRNAVKPSEVHHPL